MPLNGSEELAREYRAQLINRLRALMGTPNDSPSAKFCALGLEVINTQAKDIRNAIILAAPFWDELAQLQRECVNPDIIPGHLLEDKAFQAIECIAPVLQEYRLRHPTMQVSDAQAAFHRYFEECGEWRKEDGKLVTEYYYFVIPDGIAENYGS